MHGLDRGGGRKIRWGIEHQKAIRNGTRRRRWKRLILGWRRQRRCCRQETAAPAPDAVATPRAALPPASPGGCGAKPASARPGGPGGGGGGGADTES